MSEEIKSHHLRALASDIEDCHNPQSWADYCRAAAARIEAQAAEIARLRALCDRQSTALSLSGMRHGRILVGLERRNARQRRALAKMYQRRHDKNAALATARREGMEEAARMMIDLRQETTWEEHPEYGQICVIRNRTSEEIAAAIRAAANGEEAMKGEV